MSSRPLPYSRVPNNRRGWNKWEGLGIEIIINNREVGIIGGIVRG